MSSSFTQVSVCSVTDSNGRTHSDDPIIGSLVEIEGSPADMEFFRIRGPDAVICDLDPTGSATAQLFLGAFSLGNGVAGISATINVRAHARRALFRNAAVYEGEQNFPGGGASWQFALPLESLRFKGAGRSIALDALRAAAEAARGLVVRFGVLRPEPRIRTNELIELFHQGRFVRNPAEAIVVGTVGLWEDGDLTSASADRSLLPASGPPRPSTILGIAAEYLGPAAARVQRGRDVVSLDLISAFPEDGFDPPPAKPVKANLGTVRLGWAPPGGGSVVPISRPLAYEYATYETRGGVLDVEYDPRAVSRDDLDRGDLVLISEDDATGRRVTLLTEAGSAVTAEVDDKGIYLDPGDSAEIAISVRERGGVPRRDVTVHLWEYQSVTVPESANRRAGTVLTRVGSESSLRQRVRFVPTFVFPRGRSEPLVVPIAAMRPGPALLALTVDDQGPDLLESRPWGLNSYGGVRVLPRDSYRSVPPDVRTSWEFMYRTVFRYYRLVYPAMSQVIDFSNQTQMEDNAERIAQGIDPRLRSNTRFMPVSRDLSAGKRALIVEWAARVVRDRR
ncbi:hypothetical protein [Paludisphaera mucosa]|uniref:Uncharacterized protein n=1 Tax=Paludisphaera mucosa TaxID=3030827 RepID=A0ABT6FL87_9BACT|nr:hypothetical protein [Paludisphaera mucosa]MDG3008289.1 hypothetical protein [Paludisphaera mucosa]